MTDTLFADVSEFQAPVDDSYPYRILSFRSNDGTYQDANFVANYQWAAAAADAGKLDAFIVYCYWRANWQETAQTLINRVNAAGGPHPKMIAMIDLESGGNPGRDQSGGVNGMFDMFAQWLGNTARVIGYANAGDFDSMWVSRPNGLRVIGAGYGGNPNLPGQIAHQYTDGTYGADPANGLPSGCSPFGNCDMNSADGLSSADFAAQCGVGEDMALSQSDIDGITAAVTASVTTWLSQFIIGYVGPGLSDIKDVREQLTGSRDSIRNSDGSVNIAQSYPGWAQLGHRTVTDAIAAAAARNGVVGATDPNPNATPGA